MTTLRVISPSEFRAVLDGSLYVVEKRRGNWSLRAFPKGTVKADWLCTGGALETLISKTYADLTSHPDAMDVLKAVYEHIHIPTARAYFEELKVGQTSYQNVTRVDPKVYSAPAGVFSEQPFLGGLEHVVEADVESRFLAARG